MSDVISPESIYTDGELGETMAAAGKKTIENIKNSVKNGYMDFQALVKALKNENDDSSGSDSALNQFNKDAQGDIPRFKRYNQLKNFIKDKKEKSFNEKYKNFDFGFLEHKDWEKPDEKQLKKVKGQIDSAQKEIAIFDNLYKSFTKYMKWSLLICLFCPFVIPSMIGLFAVFGGGMAMHEVLSQRVYEKSISGLTVNGKNPYKYMHYRNGFKQIGKLYPEDELNNMLNKMKPEQKDKALQNLAQKQVNDMAANNQANNNQIANQNVSSKADGANPKGASVDEQNTNPDIKADELSEDKPGNPEKAENPVNLGKKEDSLDDSPDDRAECFFSEGDIGSSPVNVDSQDTSTAKAYSDTGRSA